MRLYVLLNAFTSEFGGSRLGRWDKVILDFIKYLDLDVNLRYAVEGSDT